MSWNYSGDPRTSTKDEVRFWLQDTDPADKLIEDEEILYVLVTEPEPIKAAASICDALSVRYSREADRQLGDFRVSLSQKAIAFAQRAKDLRTSAARNIGRLPIPYAGGISASDKQSQALNPDRVKPAFQLGMHDNPGEPTKAGEGR